MNAFSFLLFSELLVVECTHILAIQVSRTFGGKFAASTKPTPLQGFLDPLKQKLTDLKIHICILALMLVVACE